MSRRYYGLFYKQDGHWTYHLGDYDRSCVTFERQDIKDSFPSVNYRDTRLVTWDRCPTNKQIDDKVAELNQS